MCRVSYFPSPIYEGSQTSTVLDPVRLDVRPLSVFTGAEIHGEDLRQALDDDIVAQIRAALNTWKVVFFRDQFLDHAQHLAFAKRFGKPTAAHPYDAHPPEGYPQIRTISSRSTTGRRGDRWHTDVTGVINPPAASILRAGQVPTYGGDTVFTNLAIAYEHLSTPSSSWSISSGPGINSGNRLPTTTTTVCTPTK